MHKQYSFQYTGLLFLACFWQTLVSNSHSMWWMNCSKFNIIWAQNILYQQPHIMWIWVFYKAGFVFPLIAETSSEVSQLTVCGYLADVLKIHLLPHLIIGVILGCLPNSCCHGGCIRGDKSPRRQKEMDIMKEHIEPPWWGVGAVYLKWFGRFFSTSLSGDSRQSSIFNIWHRMLKVLSSCEYISILHLI